MSTQADYQNVAFGPMFTHSLAYRRDMAVMCDICNRPRPQFNHNKCSKIRQQARRKLEAELASKNGEAK